MGRFLELLQKKKFSLIVSLPANDIDLVKAAADGGADAIKVHMNVYHRASGISFGTLEDNILFFQSMHDIFKGPTGIVPGDEPKKITQVDIQTLKQVGFDFLSIYAHAAPAWVLGLKNFTTMVAISDAYSGSVRDIEGASVSPVDVIETSIVPGAGYGTPLTVQDLWHYRFIKQRVKQPVIVPTQKRVRIEDIPSLQAMGVNGLMIGAIVTGSTADDIYKQTKLYKDYIDKLWGEENAVSP